MDNPIKAATSSIKEVLTLRNFFFLLFGLILVNFVIGALVNTFPDNKAVTFLYRLFTNPFGFFANRGQS